MTLFGLLKNGEDTELPAPLPRVELPASSDYLFRKRVEEFLKAILENQGKIENRLDLIEKEILSYKESELKEAKQDIRELKSEVKHKSVYCEELLAHMLEHAQVGPVAAATEEKSVSPAMRKYLQRAKLATPAGKLP